MRVFASCLLAATVAIPAQATSRREAAVSSPWCVDYGEYLHREMTPTIGVPVGGPIETSESLVYGFVALREFGIVDASAPRDLQIVGTVSVGTVGSTMKLVDSLAFLGDISGNLLILDVADPLAPTILSTIHLGFDARRIEIHGGFAYLTTRHDIKLVDVSDPSSPFLADSLDAAGLLWTIEITDSTLYMATNVGLSIYDLAVPGAPVLQGVLPGIDFYDLELAEDGTLLTTSSVGDFALVDVSDPADPGLLGKLEFEGYHSASSVKHRGAVAYVVGSQFWCVDISDRSEPSVLGILGHATSGEVELLGDRYVITTGQGDMQIYDVANPRSTPHLGPLSVTGATNLDLSGDLLFAAGGFEGLDILRVAPDGPKEVLSHLDFVGSLDDVVVKSPYAYLANSAFGLKIADVSDPRAPVVVNELHPRGRVHDVELLGPYLYLAQGGDGVAVADLEDPVNPRGRWRIHINAMTVRFDGDYAYVGGGSEGLWILSVSDPAVPTVVSHIDTVNVWEAAIENGFAYCAGGWEYDQGLNIFDVRVPENPVLVGHHDVPRRSGSWPVPIAQEVIVRDGYVYVLLERAGLLVFDARDPTAPSLIGSHRPPTRKSLAIHATDYGIWIGGEDEVRLVPYHCPGGAGLDREGTRRRDPLALRVPATGGLAVLPNPWATSVSLEFTLERAASVRLDVWDVRGRLVRNFLDSRVDEGLHRVTWDGRDRAGANVASGVYFVRLTFGGEATVRRILRIGR